jgi:hypothetical protein
MKSKISANTINQIVTAILLAFTANGLQVNVDMTAAQIAGAVTSAQWSVLGMVAVNLGTAIFYWVQNLKDKSFNFWAFLHSKNWWLTFTNGVVGVLLYLGVPVPEGANAAVIDSVFSQTGIYGIIIAALANVVFPVIQNYVAKKPQAQTVNYNVTAN